MKTLILILLLLACSLNYSLAENSTTTATAIDSIKLSGQKSLVDARGRRTLLHYGNYENKGKFGYNRPLAQRRTGYDESRAYYTADTIYSAPYAYQPTSYVPDYSNYLTEYGTHQPHQHSHYVDQSEPIIEIIIKDSNESLAHITPQPYIEKKKKEQVQVFYVNYKKDKHTNKLHLENPIPALTPYGHDHPEEEEEEIIHYPPSVTAMPAIKTTTLRTIIHPDSEQYHSNSGIHVTFGTEDKGQYGHQFQEHNEESVLQSVVAIPNQNNYIPDSSRPHQFNVEQRSHSETGQSRNLGSNYSNNNYKLPFQNQVQNQNQHQQHAQTYVSHTLQLPSSNPSQPFRQVHSHQYQITHIPPPKNHQTHHQAQQQRSQHQQRNQQSFSQPNPTQFPSKSAIRFPTQNIAKTNVPHQLAKTRPQSLPSHKPIPIPLQNIQSEQILQQSSFKRIQPYRSQGHNIFQQPQHQSQTQYQPIPQIQSQHQPHVQVHQQQQSNGHGFNEPKETQYSQDISPISSYSVDKHHTPFLQHQFQQQSNQSFGATNSHVHEVQGLKQSQSSPSDLRSSSQNAFNTNVPPQVGKHLSPDSEFIKSVSKFEQHITETVGLDQINQHFGHSQSNDKHNFQEYSPTSDNVIHNIPAPHLGPTTSNPVIEQNRHASPQFSQFEYNSSPNTQLGNFVTQQPQFLSSTPAPPQHYGSSTPVGQEQQYSISPSSPPSQYNNNEAQIQVVTPVSLSNNQDYLNYNHKAGQPQIIPNSQPHQVNSQQLPPPGHSVSTIHTEALQELEQRRQQIFSSDDNSNRHTQNVVDISARNKYSQQQQNQHQNLHQHQQKQSQQHTTQYQSNHYHNTGESHSSTTSVLPTTKPTKNKSHVELPDEVPEELRQQLLSSGILENADISVLDYDKLGDTALENLPPEHLAHFYGAGGAAQISGSSKILTVVKPNGDKVIYNTDNHSEKLRQTHSLPKKQNVDLKVVRFDSANQKSVTDKYIRQDSTILPAVDISDRQYNRYLPLKISGTQFPIPDVDELKDKQILSVVVLAPVDNLQSMEDSSGDGRKERNIIDSKQIKFIAGESLKQLLKKPTKENFKKWLDKEAKTEIDFQSVVLLVVKNSSDEQEIFMYDISTQVVNKLNGALSSAFVNVAEENAESDDIENAHILDSGLVERMPAVSLESLASTITENGKGNGSQTKNSSWYESNIKSTSDLDKLENSKDTLRWIATNSSYSIKSKI